VLLVPARQGNRQSTHGEKTSCSSIWCGVKAAEKLWWLYVSRSLRSSINGPLGPVWQAAFSAVPGPVLCQVFAGFLQAQFPCCPTLVECHLEAQIQPAALHCILLDRFFRGARVCMWVNSILPVRFFLAGSTAFLPMVPFWRSFGCIRLHIALHACSALHEGLGVSACLLACLLSC
jgi:hypothetical protein